MYQKVTLPVTLNDVEGHFSCRNHLSTNTSVTYYAPDLRREGALSVDGRRLFVCLSVPCLDVEN